MLRVLYVTWCSLQRAWYCFSLIILLFSQRILGWSSDGFVLNGIGGMETECVFSECSCTRKCVVLVWIRIYVAPHVAGKSRCIFTLNLNSCCTVLTGPDIIRDMLRAEEHKTQSSLSAVSSSSSLYSAVCCCYGAFGSTVLYMFQIFTKSCTL